MVLTVQQAKSVAKQWVTEEGSKLTGFSGAYLVGSILLLPDNAVYPDSSDVDIHVVLSEPPSLKLGKFVYHNVLLEVSYTSPADLKSPDIILAHFQMASGIRSMNILLDPFDQLTKLRVAVSNDYAKRNWVRKRCEHAHDLVLQRLQTLDGAAPYYQQVTQWLFGISLTTHVLLMAGLKSPTVRKRYLKTQELLAEYNHLDVYEGLLDMLGCAQMKPARVEYHLNAVAAVFDAAKTCIKTPYQFASDISDAGRPIVIDGSRELIAQGYHREAIFYMLATYSRCQHILYHDAPPEIQDQFNVGYQRFLEDLGITSFADLQQRCQQGLAFLPQVQTIAEAIMVANPEIED